MSQPGSGGPLKPGVILAGRYVIEQKLGAGGFGIVYRAKQQPLGRAVAIKVLLASTAAIAPDARERFFREAHLAERLEHPNTVRVLDLGQTDAGLPFIVWELLRGKALGDHLDAEGKMNDAQVHRVATQILKSLMEAHALGVVHRDIKPANIFITSHPGEPLFVKVLDFGIAKDLFAASAPAGVSKTIVTPIQQAAAAPHLTRESQTLGTPRYMAPEQISGDVVGPWTDLYAVGLVMAEMLTGRPVYESESALSMLLDRASGRSTPLAPEIARSRLFNVIARATAKMPAERYESAASMLAELGVDPSAMPISAAQHPQPASSTFQTGGAGSAPVQRAQVTQITNTTPPHVAHSPHAASHPITMPAAGAQHPATPFTPRASFSGPAPSIATPPAAVVTKPSPSKAPWIALGVAVPLALAAAGGGYFFYARDAKAKKSPSDTRETKTSAPAKPSADAPPPGPAPAPSVPIAQRQVPVLTMAQVAERLTAAGYMLQPGSPTEEKSAFGRLVIAAFSRGECFGAVHYYEYRTEQDLEPIHQSLLKLQRGHTLHRTGARMVSANVVGRSNVTECEQGLLDIMTR